MPHQNNLSLSFVRHFSGKTRLPIHPYCAIVHTH